VSCGRIMWRPKLRLIKLWLKTPVEETDPEGRRRMSGGKQSTCGTPQGGVISPLLANRYMNRFLRHWRQQGCGEAFCAHVVNYADDFVILTRGHAEEALTWTRRVMTRLGLTVNEAKTTVRDARQERFDFLGYSVGPHHYRKDGHWYLRASPSQKRVQRLKGRVGEILVPSNVAPWDEVRGRLNHLLRGWAGYFAYGTRLMAYRAADNHVYETVRGFLKRRHKVPSHAARRQQADGGRARYRQRSDVHPQHRLPVGIAAEGPSAAQHGERLFPPLGLGRNAGAHSPCTVCQVPGIGRAGGQPDGRDHRQPER